ncbi:hypothetical protein ACWJJH_03530 [Endozoicomonadaceae bacterium StTr2]
MKIKRIPALFLFVMSFPAITFAGINQITIDKLVERISCVFSVDIQWQEALKYDLEPCLAIIFERSIWCQYEIDLKECDSGFEIWIPDNGVLVELPAADVHDAPYLYDWYGGVSRLDVPLWLAQGDCLTQTEYEGFCCLSSEQESEEYLLIRATEMQQQVSSPAAMGWVVIQPVYMMYPDSYSMYPGYAPGYMMPQACIVQQIMNSGCVSGYPAGYGGLITTDCNVTDSSVTDSSISPVSTIRSSSLPLSDHGNLETDIQDRKVVLGKGVVNSSYNTDYPELGPNPSLQPDTGKYRKSSKRVQYKYTSVSLKEFCNYLGPSGRPHGNTDLRPLFSRKSGSARRSNPKVVTGLAPETDVIRRGSDIPPVRPTPDKQPTEKLSKPELTLELLDQDRVKPYWFQENDEKNKQVTSSTVRKRIVITQEKFNPPPSSTSKKQTSSVSRHRKHKIERACLFPSQGYDAFTTSHEQDTKSVDCDQTLLAAAQTEEGTHEPTTGPIQSIPTLRDIGLVTDNKLVNESVNSESLSATVSLNEKVDPSLPTEPPRTDVEQRQRYSVDIVRARDSGCLKYWWRYARSWLPCRSSKSLQIALQQFTTDARALLASCPENDYEVVMLKLSLNSYVCLDCFALGLGKSAILDVMDVIRETDNELLQCLPLERRERRERAQLALFMIRRHYDISDDFDLDTSRKAPSTAKFTVYFQFENQHRREAGRFYLKANTRRSKRKTVNRLALAECEQRESNRVSADSRKLITAMLEVIQSGVIWKTSMRAKLDIGELNLEPDDLVDTVQTGSEGFCCYPLFHELVPAIDSHDGLQALARQIDRLQHETGLNFAAGSRTSFEIFKCHCAQNIAIQCYAAGFLFKKDMRLFFRLSPPEEGDYQNFLVCDLENGEFTDTEAVREMTDTEFMKIMEYDTQPSASRLEDEDGRIELLVQQLTHFRRMHASP